MIVDIIKETVLLVMLGIIIYENKQVIKLLRKPIVSKPVVVKNKIPWVKYSKNPPADGFDPSGELGDFFIHTETLDCYICRLNINKQKRWFKIGSDTVTYTDIKKRKIKKGSKNPQIVKIVKEKKGRKR